MADQQATALPPPPAPVANPNAGYPPAYPPQQPVYPPQQQQAYPPPSYPPQQPPAGGYGYPPPPQQQAYPPQPGPGYPPKQPDPGFTAGAPPPYKPQYPGYAPTPQTQSTSANVVVVQPAQPTVVRTTTIYTRHYGQGDHGLLYAIISSCIVFWFLGWPGLICTIAGIFFALSAQQDEHTGNVEVMRQHHNWSLILTTVGLVCGFGFMFIWIISSASS